MNTEPRETKRDATERLYLGWIVSAGLSFILLVITYYLVATESKHDQPADALTELTLAVVANLIPISLVFVLSWFLLRHFRKEQERWRETRLAQSIADQLTLRLKQEVRPLPAAVVESASERLSAIIDAAIAAGMSGHIDALSTVLSELKETSGLLRVQEGSMTVTFYERFEELPWEQLLHGAKSVDVIVHYFDTWVSRHESALREFFGSGGVLRLVLPNPDNASLIGVITERFPEYEPGSVERKIRNCPNRFASMKLTKNGRIEAYFTDRLLWYPALRFDRRHLVLGMYEHMRELRVESPAVLLELPSYDRTAEWYERDFEGLVQGAASSVRH